MTEKGHAKERISELLWTVKRSMKQAEKLIQEINRKVIAIQQTESRYLRKDYYASIKKDMRELKAYCKYKGINYEEVRREILRF